MIVVFWTIRTTRDEGTHLESIEHDHYEVCETPMEADEIVAEISNDEDVWCWGRSDIIQQASEPHWMEDRNGRQN